MKLSIIIPSYNSGKRLITLLEKLQKIKINGFTKEIIVINDASTDPVYSKVKKSNNIIYIEHKKNTGKGGAVMTGFEKATGDVLLIQDDDLEYDPSDIPILLAPIIAKKTRIVFGSRRLNRKNIYSSKKYLWGGILVNLIISVVLRRRLTDPITGYKALTRNVYNKLKPIESKGFEVEAELTAKAVRERLSIIEVPIRYSPRTHQEGKNIRWYHGFKIILALLKYR